MAWESKIYGGLFHRAITGRAGFTLVELLVSLGVIAVLASILLTGIGLVRRQANQTLCMSNLRQWSLAARSYATSNDGYLPRRGQGQQMTTLITRPEDWFNALPPLIQTPPFSRLAVTGQLPRASDHGIWICPETPEFVTGYNFTYGMNMWLSTWLTPKPDQVLNVGEVTTMVFMADAPSGYCSVVPAAADYSPVARHAGRVNIAFLDGHVTSFSGDYVGCGKGDPLRNDIRWVVPGSPWSGPNP